MSERFARGLTLKLSLAAENNLKINEETWKKALAAHPNLSPHYEAAKGKFLAEAMEKLVNATDRFGTPQLTYLCWLLERRHSDLFARPAEVSLSVNNTTNISGLSNDVLDQARAIARAEALAGSHHTGKSNGK